MVRMFSGEFDGHSDVRPPPRAGQVSLTAGVVLTFALSGRAGLWMCVRPQRLRQLLPVASARAEPRARPGGKGFWGTLPAGLHC